MPKVVERFSSDELADLMDRVQQLMEANVLAMVLRHPGGGVSVSCPPHRREEIKFILRTYDWETFDA